jgi:hypothetical protein
MRVIVRKESETIFNRLEKEITPTVLEKLKTHWSVFWKDYGSSSWRKKELGNIFELAFKIQDILNARAGRITIDYRFGGGLPKNYALEIANDILKLSLPEKTPQRQIINAILKRIEEESN